VTCAQPHGIIVPFWPTTPVEVGFQEHVAADVMALRAGYIFDLATSRMAGNESGHDRKGHCERRSV
jgi:hypothetical protein